MNRVPPALLAPAVVMDDADPQQGGRVRVNCPAFFDQPIWARPCFAAGMAWAIPSVGDPVLIACDAPGSYRWIGTPSTRDANVPAWAATEYPNRRALAAKLATTLVGLDESGYVYLGHFDATEPAVLGTTLNAKLESALSAIETGLGVIRDAAYGVYAMDGGSKAAVTSAISQVQTARAGLDDALSEQVKVAKDAEV